MGSLHPRPLLCERTRGWASLALDGELSEFERALMRSHVERCPACALFVQEIGSATRVLREAPPERIPHPVGLPARPRRVSAGVLRLGAVAGVVIGTLGLAGTLTVDPGAPPRADVAVRAAPSDQQNDRLLRVTQRIALVPAPLPDRGRKVLTLPL